MDDVLADDLCDALWQALADPSVSPGTIRDAVEAAGYSFTDNDDLLTEDDNRDVILRAEALRIAVSDQRDAARGGSTVDEIVDRAKAFFDFLDGQPQLPEPPHFSVGALGTERSNFRFTIVDSPRPE